MDDQEKTREQCIEELQQARVEITRSRAEVARLRQELSQAVSKGQADFRDTLEQERLLLRTLINQLPTSIYVKDTESRFTMANESVAGLMGAKPEDLIGKTDFDFFPAELATGYYNDEQRILSTGQPIIGKEERTLKSGQERWIITSKVPLRDASGKVIGILGTGQDATERRHFEDQLAKEREALASAMEAAQMASWEFDVKTGQFIFNEPYYRFLGTSLEQQGTYRMTAQEFSQKFVHPDDMQMTGDYMRKAMAAKDSDFRGEFEARVRRADGSYMYVLLTLRILRDGQGNIVSFFGTNQDITKRKQFEQQLARERSTLAAAMEAADMANWEFDVASGTFLLNEMYYRFMRITAEQVGGYVMPASVFAEDYVHPDDAADVGVHIERALTTTDPNHREEFEARLRRGDGTLINVLVTLRIEKDAQGNTVRFYGTNQNITERKQFELQLAQERSTLASAMEAADMANWEFDITTGNFIFNDMYYRFLGTTIEQEGSYLMPVAIFAQKFLHPEDAPNVGLTIQKAIETPDASYREEIESRLIRADGTVINTLVNLQIEKDSHGKIVRFYGTNQNITERRRGQELVARRAAELATVAEVSTLISTILEPDEMLQRVVDLTKERFDLYHAHLYLLNEAGDTLVLTTGAGEVGRQMVAEKRIIPIDAEKSLVARTARSWRGTIVNDVWQDPEFLPHPLLPDTRAEMAVPVIIGDQLLGVLDVQDDEAGRFSEEGMNVLTTLGAQIAVALQNARQYARMQASEELVRTVIDATPDWIFIKDRDHRFRLVNRAFAASLHFEPEEMIGKNDLDLGFPEELVKGNPEKGLRGFWADDEDAIASSQPSVIPQDMVMVDGKLRILSTYKTAVRDENGHAWGVLGFSRDVTEREELLQDLERERRTLEAVLNNMPAGVFMVEAPSGKPILSNRKAEEFLGRGISPTAVGDDLNQVYQAYRFGTDELYPAAEMPIVAGMFGQHKTIYDMEVRRPDGDRLLLEVNGAPVFNAEGQVVASVVVFQDTTERFKLQQENRDLLDDSQKRARMLEKISQAQYDLSLTTNEEEIVKAIARVLNLGEGQSLLLSYVDEDESEAGVPRFFSPKVNWLNGNILPSDPSMNIRMDVRNTPMTELWLKSPDTVRFIPDWRTDPSVDPGSRAMIEPTGMITWAIIPLVSGGHWQGTLAMSWNQVHDFSDEEKAIIQQLREPVSSALARRRAAQAESQALKETEALYEGSRQLSRSRSYDEVLQTLVRNSVLQQYDTASIMLFNRPWKDTPPENAFVIASWERTAGTLSLKSGDVLPIASITIINPQRLATSIVISDLDDTQQVDADLRAYFTAINRNFRSVITLQMVIAGDWIGTINVASLQPMKVTEADLRYLKNLVEQAATIIQNLSLFEQIQRTLEETANLYVTSRRMNEATNTKEMLEAVMEGLHIPDINRAVLVLSEYDEAGEVNAMLVASNWHSGSGTRPVPVGTRFGREVYRAVKLFQKEAPVFYEDAQNDPNLDPATLRVLRQSNIASIAFLPLWVGGRQIGALLLETEVIHHFTEEEMRSFPAMVSQLAVVVENRRLLEAAEDRARREQMISDIASRVRNSMDAGIVMRTAVRDLSTALGRPVFIRLGSAEQLTGADGKPGQEPKQPGDGQQREGGK